MEKLQKLKMHGGDRLLKILSKRTGLIIAIVISSILSLGMVILIAHLLANSVAIHLISRIQTTVVEKITSDIEKYLEQIARPLVKYTADNDLSIYIKGAIDELSIRLLQWEVANANNALRLEGYLEIFIMLKDNRVVSEDGLVKMSIPTKVTETIFSGEKEHDIYMLYEYKGKKNIAVLVGIKGPDGKTKAILIGLYPADDLQKLIVQTKFGKSGYVGLLYGTLTVAHPMEEYVGNFDLANNRWTKSFAEMIMKYEKGEGIYTFQVKKFATFRKVAKYNLTVVAVIPYSEIVEEANNVVRLRGFSHAIITLSTFLVILFSVVIILFAINVEKNERLKKMVDELNEMNNELEAAFNELKEAQSKIINSEKMAALGKMMVNIAHDVNTPAGVIYSSLTEVEHTLNDMKNKFFSEELTEGEFLDKVDVLYQLTEIMTRNIRRIIDLVQSLKRVAISEMVENYSSVNLKALVEDVLRAMYPKLRKSNVKIYTEIPNDLVVYSIPGALAQILINLIDNVLMHAFDENEEGTLHIKAEKIVSDEGKEVIKITFTDNGKGMDEKTKKHAFEPFFTTKPGVGSGLGLSIVYTLVVEKLGGEIDLESLPATGTKIIIKIPEKRGDEHNEHDEQSDKNSGK
jgi:signal transduction histidine kinase